MAERDMALREADSAIDSKRKGMLAAQMELEQREKLDDFKRFGEADSAFNKYNAAVGLIDWGSPDSGKQYESVLQQYAPEIQKHDKVAKKFDAIDRVTKANQYFTTKRVLEQAEVTSMREAAELMPELLLDPPRKPDGTPDKVAIADKLRQYKQDQMENALELRRASIDARGEWGGYDQKPKLSEAARAELQATKQELVEIDKTLANPRMAENPDAKLKLLNRKSSVLKRIRAFDDGQQAPAAQPGRMQKPPDAAAQSAVMKIGKWNVSFKNDPSNGYPQATGGE